MGIRSVRKRNFRGVDFRGSEREPVESHACSFVTWLVAFLIAIFPTELRVQRDLFSRRENKWPRELPWFQFFFPSSCTPFLPPRLSSSSARETIAAISESFIQNEVIKKVVAYILSIAIFNWEIDVIRPTRLVVDPYHSRGKHECRISKKLIPDVQRNLTIV